MVADLSTEQGVAALIAAVPVADVLVNNLGIFNDKDFFTVPDDEWMHFYNVNVLSGVRRRGTMRQPWQSKDGDALFSCRPNLAWPFPVT